MTDSQPQTSSICINADDAQSSWCVVHIVVAYISTMSWYSLVFLGKNNKKVLVE